MVCLARDLMFIDCMVKKMEKNYKGSFLIDSVQVDFSFKYKCCMTGQLEPQHSCEKIQLQYNIIFICHGIFSISVYISIKIYIFWQAWIINIIVSGIILVRSLFAVLLDTEKFGSIYLSFVCSICTYYVFITFFTDKSNTCAIARPRFGESCICATSVTSATSVVPH